MAGIIATEQADLPAYQVVRRQRVIDAAKNLLRSQDYDSIQIRDVAAASNVALGTLYRYFTSKEHLYANVLYDWALPLSQDNAEDLKSLDTCARIRRRLHGALSSFERHPYFYRAILQLRGSAAEDVTPVMAKLGDMLETPMRRDMRLLDDTEAADITVMVWALLMDVVSRVMAGDKTMDEAYRVLDRFVAMIEHRLERTGS